MAVAARRPGRRGGCPGLFWLVGAAALAAIFAGLIVPGWVWDRQRAVRAYANWRLEGPPCAVVAEAPDPPSLRRTFVLSKLAVSYRYGALSCTLLHQAQGRGSGMFPVCQLTSPGVVRVAHLGRVVAYAPGPGQSATVYVRGGRAVCVTDANPELFDFTRDRPFER